MCVFSLLRIGSELGMCDPLFGLGVDVRTGNFIPCPTGVFGTEPLIGGVGLHSVMLNPMSIRSSIFHNMERESG